MNCLKRINEDYQYAGRNKVFAENNNAISPDDFESKDIDLVTEASVEDNL